MTKKKMTLDEARSAIFASKAYHGPTLDVEIEGIVLEIRAPRAKHSLATARGKRGAGVPIDDVLLECVYHKESGMPFFTKEHLELLEEASAHADGILEVIGQAVSDVTQMCLAQVTKDDEKNS